MNVEKTIETTIIDLANILGPKLIDVCNTFKNEVLEAEMARPEETDTAVAHAVTGVLMGIVVKSLPSDRREKWIEHLQVSFREKFEEVDGHN